MRRTRTTSVTDPAGGTSAARWIERCAALLLASAALATAWSSYQASRWTGEQAKSFAAANAARVESTKAANLANAQTEVDVSVFTEWVDAYLRGEQQLTTFYRQRFREEFVPAFEAWIAEDPFEDPSAPPTPFAMPEYVLDARQEADALEAAADTGAEQAREHVQRATNYVLGVVLFATGLFFAGISTKLVSDRLRMVILTMGGVVFVLSAGWIATFPISLSI
jgi:hypothetical protein